jgi:hypothetical protein
MAEITETATAPRERNPAKALERAKIQAEILAPVLHALEEELGKGRARALLRAAMSDHYRKGFRDWVTATPPDRVRDQFWTVASNGAAWEEDQPIRIEQKVRTSDRAEINVVECSYAKFFNEIGEPDLGFLLLCSADFDMIKEVPGLELTRTQTIMQGASHCDFQYRLVPQDAPEDPSNPTDLR